MNKEIKEIINRYIDNKELKKFSNHYYSDYIYSEGAKTKEEINKMTMGIDSTLNYYAEQESLADQDIEIMERRVAEYELAVFKILSQDVDLSFNYSSNEVQKLIDHITEYYRKLENIEKIERVENSKIGYTF